LKPPPKGDVRCASPPCPPQDGFGKQAAATSRMNSNMVEEEPNLITSPKSQQIEMDGYPFSIEIYRFEDEPEWSLEVVDFVGTSYVWGDLLKFDKDARNAAITELENEGALSFMRGDNVIPFKN
jgi:hypothetical protein